MNKSIEQIINDVIAIEGGYTNNPDDKGGPTNFGITLSTYKTIKPYATANDVKNMTRQEAVEIYKKQYLINTNVILIYDVSPNIMECVFDATVNMGTAFAVKTLQRCLNVFNLQQKIYPDIVVDGAIGNKTISSLKAFLSYRGQQGEDTILKAMKCIRGNRYIELAEQRAGNESFIYGWIRTRI